MLDKILHKVEVLKKLGYEINDIMMDEDEREFVLSENEDGSKTKLSVEELVRDNPIECYLCGFSDDFDDMSDWEGAYYHRECLEDLKERKHENRIRDN